MKKRRDLILASLAVLIALALWLLSQNSVDYEPEGPVVYFTVSDEKHNGPALGCEPYTGPKTEAMKIPNPRFFMMELLKGPTSEGLTSPFPKGVSLESWKFDSSNPTNLQIRMSEPYNGLTDISLTLADYCIVLTMSQIPGVETVEIVSGSYSASYRSHKQLRADEVELIEPLTKTNSAS